MQPNASLSVAFAMEGERRRISFNQSTHTHSKNENIDLSKSFCRYKTPQCLKQHMRSHGQAIGEQNLECEICSNKFQTSDELNAHRQQGCVRLIDIGSIAVDCKPTAMDFAEDSHWDGNESIDNDDLEQQPENSMDANEKGAKRGDKRLKPTNLQPKEVLHECPECGKKYEIKGKLEVHQRQKHGQKAIDEEKDYSVEVDGKRRFKCPLCDTMYVN